MVVLLVAYHIDHLVNGEIGKAQFGRTYILGHINRSAVGTEQQFVVEPLSGQVGPYGTVFFAVEEAFLQTFHNLLLALQISFRLVVNLVERNAHHTVGFIEACIYPIIHLLPQSTDLRVAGFPLHQHLTRFFHQGRFRFGFCLGLFFAHAFTLELRHQLFYLSLIMLVESHIIVTYQMVAFLAGRFGSFTVTVLLPSQH